MVAINASWGLGLAVVGGEVTPDDYLVSKVTARGGARRRSPTRTIEYVPDADGTAPCAVDVAAGAPRRPLPGRRAPGRAGRRSRRVERHFGSHQDIEWAIDAASGDAVHRCSRARSPAVAKPKPKPAAELGDRRWS